MQASNCFRPVSSGIDVKLLSLYSQLLKLIDRSAGRANIKTSVTSLIQSTELGEKKKVEARAAQQGKGSLAIQISVRNS